MELYAVATPPSAPVQVEYTAPPPIATGDSDGPAHVSRSRIRSTGGIGQAFDGLGSLYPNAASFQNVKKGEGRRCRSRFD